MDINLICIGKIKEDYLVKGIEEYKKRIRPFCNFSIIELKEINNYEVERNILEEGKLILKEIKPTDYLITLEIDGDEVEIENYQPIFIDKKNIAITGKHDDEIQDEDLVFDPLQQRMTADEEMAQDLERSYNDYKQKREARGDTRVLKLRLGKTNKKVIIPDNYFYFY